MAFKTSRPDTLERKIKKNHIGRGHVFILATLVNVIESIGSVRHGAKATRHSRSPEGLFRKPSIGRVAFNHKDLYLIAP